MSTGALALTGLNEGLHQITNYILALPNLPSIDVTFDMICQAESEVAVTEGPCVEMSSLYVNQPDENNKNDGRGKSLRKSKMFCTHCQGMGHTMEYCYELVGLAKSPVALGEPSLEEVLPTMLLLLEKVKRKRSPSLLQAGESSSQFHSQPD